MQLFEHLRVDRRRLFVQRGIEFILFTGTILLAVAGFVRVVPALIGAPDQIDFGAYYVAARVLNAHGELYQPDVARAAASAAGNVHATPYIYPPFWATVIRPLALLPYITAEITWMGLNYIFLVLSVTILVRLLELPSTIIVPITGMSLLLPAVYDTILLGQTSLLITLLLVGALACSVVSKVQRRNDVIAGVLLGIAIAIKVYPAVMGLVFMIHRRMTILVALAITIVLTTLFGVFFGGGWSNTQQWVTNVLPSISVMTPFPSNQSLRAVIERFFSFNQFQVPVLAKDNFLTITLTPLVDNAMMGTAIGYIGIAFILGVSVVRMIAHTRIEPAKDALLVNFALSIIVMLLITPVVWDLYLVHLLVPVLVLGRYAYMASGQRLIILSACLLLMLQRYWRWVLLYIQSPWLMLFGFLSVLVLWLALLRMPIWIKPSMRDVPDTAEDRDCAA
jgi:alpha-1,2-mannosyltransferase